MKNIFDTHAHYTDAAFDSDRKDLLGSLENRGICGIINCGFDIASSHESLALAKNYGYIYAACGVHPEEIHKLAANWEQELNSMLDLPECVAVGEIGLDYHWRSDDREEQKVIFEKQIILANEKHLPVIVHDREAHEDTYEILKKHKPQGVLHCFSGSAESAAQLIKDGMYIGLGGALTFKNARRAVEVAAAIPLERLLFETDCPYMAPVPHRGERNDSRLIEFVAQCAAEIRGTDAQALLDITAENARKLFLE